MKVPVKRRVPKQKTREFPPIVLTLMNGDSIQQTAENRSALITVVYFGWYKYPPEVCDRARVVFQQWDAADEASATPGTRRQ
jgi:hypothetical protein